MKILKNTVFALLNFLALSFPVLAQYRSSEPDPSAACGLIGCGIVVYLLIIGAVIVGSIVVVIVIYKFIKRDAIARGDSPGKAWLALLGLLGLLIYVLTRPQGNVMPCPSCGQSRMQGLPRCPHCGNP